MINPQKECKCIIIRKNMKVLFDNLIAMCSSMLAHYANPFNPMVCS